jgi:hypothetical protein
VILLHGLRDWLCIALEFCVWKALVNEFGFELLALHAIEGEASMTAIIFVSK